MTVVAESPGHADVALRVRPELLQTQGIVHGGVLSALADSAAAAAFRLIAPEERISTIELTVTYLAPARDGTLIASADVVSVRRRIFVADVVIRDSADNRTALARAVYRRSGPSPVGPT